MVTDIRSSIGARLREERERLDLSQVQMAALAEFKLRTYQDWERGIAAVSSEFLALAAPHGLDVFYVLTGERMSSKLTLDPSRAPCWAAWRSAPRSGRWKRSSTWRCWPRACRPRHPQAGDPLCLR